MKTLTEDKTCPECGAQNFTLCEDFTRYSLVIVQDGKLVAEYDHEEMSEADFDPLWPRRLMCCECGEYVEVPEELG